MLVPQDIKVTVVVENNRSKLDIIIESIYGVPIYENVAFR